MPKTRQPYIVTVIDHNGDQVQTYHPHETATLERLKETLRFPEFKGALITRYWGRTNDDVARSGDRLIEDAEEELIHEASNGGE
jgi:hypothetical protein